MNRYQVPDYIDLDALERILTREIRAPLGYAWTNPHTLYPYYVVFDPDLTTEELATLTRILDYYNGASNFETLPNWANWTAAEAETNITGAIFGGASQAVVDAQIDALPATIAGMKTGLKSAAAQIIAIRGILAAIGKGLVYIRNLVVKLR